MDNLTNKLLGWFLIIASVFMAAKAVSEIRGFKFIGQAPNMTNLISITGSGEAFAKPDVAEISFSVTAESATVADTQDKAAKVENEVTAFLKKEGVEEKDVKTSNYSLSPRYEYRATVCTPTYCPPGDTRVLIGYEVRESIVVKVRKIDEAGKILAGLGGFGVTDISGVNLTVDDPEKAQNEARREAIKEVREKAKELAQDLDVRLKRIVSFSEDNGGAITPLYGLEKMGIGGAADVSVRAPSLPVGENAFRSNVTITYEIE